MAAIHSDYQDLTGIWNGLYTYRDGRTTTFVATLIQSGGALSGTTHEPDCLHPEVTACATIVGNRHDGVITFVKSYDPPTCYYNSPVHYEGRLNGDATEIEGRWAINPACDGKFLVQRPARSAATTSRQAVERV